VVSWWGGGEGAVNRREGGYEGVEARVKKDRPGEFINQRIGIGDEPRRECKQVGWQKR
jgi:hypothetical protein